MCRRVINIITVRVEEVTKCNGAHIEHLIISMQWSFFYILVSSILIEIMILLLDEILDHFVRQPVDQHPACSFLAAPIHLATYARLAARFP
jgi:hypothetical protein